MTTTIQVLDTKLSNAAALDAAARVVGLPLHIAAALTQKESGGRNVYGNDVGGTFSTPGTPDKAVTKANYAEFYQLVVVQGRKSNGVGPLQITYRGYFPQAAEQGLRLWTPFDNYRFGFSILLRNLRGEYTTSSIQRAGTLYNAGNLNSGITTYGRDLASKASAWKTWLSGATAPRQLDRGDTGADVARLQEGLMRRFATLAQPIVTYGGADGSFGSATESVVKAFQTYVKITANGSVGSMTRGHLTVYGIEP